MGLTGPVARSVSPPTHIPFSPIRPLHRVSPGKEAADLELPKATCRGLWGVPALGLQWEKGFFVWRECKRIAGEGGSHPPRSIEGSWGHSPGGTFFQHFGDVFPNQPMPLKPPPYLPASRGPSPAARRQTHKEKGCRVVPERCPCSPQALWGMAGSGHPAPQNSWWGCKGRGGDGSRPPPHSPSISIPPPGMAETEEAMKITIGPTCRHTSLPARSRGRWGCRA